MPVDIQIEPFPESVGHQVSGLVGEDLKLPPGPLGIGVSLSNRELDGGPHDGFAPLIQELDRGTGRDHGSRRYFDPAPLHHGEGTGLPRGFRSSAGFGAGGQEEAPGHDDTTDQNREKKPEDRPDSVEHGSRRGG